MSAGQRTDESPLRPSAIDVVVILIQSLEQLLDNVHTAFMNGHTAREEESRAYRGSKPNRGRTDFPIAGIHQNDHRPTPPRVWAILKKTRHPLERPGRMKPHIQGQTEEGEDLPT